MLEQSTSFYPIVLISLSILRKRNSIGYVVTLVICCWVFTDVNGSAMSLESHLPLGCLYPGPVPPFWFLLGDLIGCPRLASSGSGELGGLLASSLASGRRGVRPGGEIFFGGL